MMNILRYFLWSLLVLIGLAITSLNAEPVILNYYSNTISLPLSLLLICSFTLGWLLGLGLNLMNHIKLRASNRRLQHHYQIAQLEIEDLKKNKAFQPISSQDQGHIPL
jgi:uncharacterized integral membrane protein